MPENETRDRLKLIEILKKYTDKENPKTQKELRAIEDADKLMGYKNTFTRRLFEIAEAYNTDSLGNLLNDKEWRIVYSGYKEKKENPEKNGIRNGKIYYNHSVTKQELDFLIYSVRNSDSFSEAERISLEEKLKKELASNAYFYEEDYPKELVHKFNDTEKRLVEENIRMLRNAINDGHMVSFMMTGIDSSGKRFVKKEQPYCVTPYMIVLYDGKYWLLANCQREYLNETGNSVIFSSGVNVYRIDKMQGLRYEPTESGNIRKARFPYKNKEKIELWDKQVAYLHKEEFASGGEIKDAPCFSFKIMWNNFPDKEIGDYTFVYDAFGKTFYVEDDIVYVKASPSFFEEWVIRCGKRIIVTENTEASKKMKNRLKTIFEELNRAYT